MTHTKDSFWHDGRYIHPGTQVWTVMPKLLTIVNHSVIRKHNHAWVACTHAPMVKPSHCGDVLIDIKDFNKTPPDGARSFMSLEEAEAAFHRLVGQMIQKLENKVEELEAEKMRHAARIDASISSAQAKIVAAKSVLPGGVT